jgi:hypothetical protein
MIGKALCFSFNPVSPFVDRLPLLSCPASFFLAIEFCLSFDQVSPFFGWFSPVMQLNPVFLAIDFFRLPESFYPFLRSDFFSPKICWCCCYPEVVFL